MSPSEGINFNHSALSAEDGNRPRVPNAVLYQNARCLKFRNSVMLSVIYDPQKPLELNFRNNLFLDLVLKS